MANQPTELQQLINAVEAALAVHEKTWKPMAFSDNVTFFSSQDVWVFIPSWDAKQCDACGEIALGVPEHTGDSLRGTFPYLEIRDADTIDALVHPNCRCILVRFGEFSKTKVMDNPWR